jgi:predicted RNA binding protein YcfA (HicA-like mRNA interferase family)
VPKLRPLGGADVVKLLSRHGFSVTATRGSHAKLKRTAGGVSQTLTIPLHKELATGTLFAIYRQCCRYVPEESLRGDFYTE